MTDYQIVTSKEPLEHILKEITVIILGETGIGKTQMAATFPNPIFIDLDQGGQFVSATRVIPRNMRELETVIRDLEIKFSKSDCPYDTIVVDTVDEMVSMVKTDLLGTADKMTQDKWDRLLNRVMPMLGRLKKINSNLVICAQTKTISSDDGGPANISLAIPSSAKSRIPQMAGWIFHLRLDNDGKVVALTKPARGKAGQFQAKDRSGLLPTTIEPTYNAFVEALREAFAKQEEVEEND